jgi:hypothetical protein
MDMFDGKTDRAEARTGQMKKKKKKELCLRKGEKRAKNEERTEMQQTHRT